MKCCASLRMRILEGQVQTLRGVPVMSTHSAPLCVPFPSPDTGPRCDPAKESQSFHKPVTPNPQWQNSKGIRIPVRNDQYLNYEYTTPLTYQDVRWQSHGFASLGWGWLLPMLHSWFWLVPRSLQSLGRLRVVGWQCRGQGLGEQVHQGPVGNWDQIWAGRPGCQRTGKQTAWDKERGRGQDHFGASAPCDIFHYPMELHLQI